jgi:hypothetical protein
LKAKQVFRRETREFREDEFKNRRNSRSRRGNEADVLFAVKSASLRQAATIVEHALANGWIAGRSKNPSLVAADVSRLKFSWKAKAVQSRLTSAATCLTGF